MKSLRDHINAKRRKDIKGIFTSKVVTLPLVIVITYIFLQAPYLLFLLFFVILIILFITIPVWKKKFKNRSEFGSRFLEILESKSMRLEETFQTLFRTQIPRNVYWINFEINPSTFEIETATHSANADSTLELKNSKTVLKTLLKANESTISGLKKDGWEAEDNIELMLELILRWFYEIWNHEVPDNFKIRSTFSVEGRQGYFDLKTKEWEDINYLFGNPLN